MRMQSADYIVFMPRMSIWSRTAKTCYNLQPLPRPAAAMSGNSSNGKWLRFGRFELAPQSGELRKSGNRVRLGPQPLKVLTVLATRAGELVTRQELKEQVWGEETFVDFEQGLNFCVKQIRAVLGDDADNPAYIETVPKRGYRFVAEVVEHTQDGNGNDFSSAIAASPSTAPPSASPVSTKLKTAVVLAAVSACAVLALYFFRHSSRTTALENGPIRSVAVLPFEDLSGDTSQRYFADGITEAISGDLAQVDALRVISRSSAMQYRDSHKTVPQIGRELRVDGIVEGTVARSGERVRVTAELLDTRTDSHLWANSYDRDVRNILSLQSEVAGDIAGQVAAKLTAQQRQALGEKRVVDPAAHEAYLRGRFVWNERTEHSYLEAIRFFNEALAHDPGYADAYAGLADAYALLGSLASTTITRTDAMEKARAAANRAIQLDPDLAEAHTSLAFVLMHYDWKFAEAQKEFEVALRLNPNYATAHQWYAYDLMAMGRSQESLDEIVRAQQIDPLSLIIANDSGELLVYAGKALEGVHKYEEVTALNPNFPLTHSFLAYMYAFMGDSKRAGVEAEQYLALTNDGMSAELVRAYVAARTGNARAARRVLNQLAGQAQRTGSCAQVAVVYTALRDSDAAFAWLRRALDQREGSLIALRDDPVWDPLRSDPRFPDLLRRVGLPTS